MDWANISQSLQAVFEYLKKNSLKLDAAVHCASDMTYSRMKLFEAYNQNVLASLELHQTLSDNYDTAFHQGSRFYFYSTAYVCGIKPQQRITETLHIGANVPSIYHLTKSITEKDLWLRMLDAPKGKTMPVTNYVHP